MKTMTPFARALEKAESDSPPLWERTFLFGHPDRAEAHDLSLLRKFCLIYLKKRRVRLECIQDDEEFRGTAGKDTRPKMPVILAACGNGLGAPYVIVDGQDMLEEARFKAQQTITAYVLEALDLIVFDLPAPVANACSDPDPKASLRNILRQKDIYPVFSEEDVPEIKEFARAILEDMG